MPIGYSHVMLCCIRDLDAELAMSLWAHERPNSPQPENVHQARMMLHYARTQLNNLPHKLRFYSHRWLTDNGYPSALPDHLKGKAERMYPVVVTAVGVSSSSLSGRKSALNRAIEGVMSDAVLETLADGYDPENPAVKARILEKRADFKRRA